jgi:hypothetical protein
MIQMKNTFFIGLLLLCTSTANAKLAGKNVVLVHGFQPGQLQTRPNESGQQADAIAYWSDYWGSRAEANIYWSSTERVGGGIKDSLKRQIQNLESQGTCSNGCVFVTHSTGDLVVRDALTRLNQWGINPNRFRVLAVLDFAGAGGGTELADIAVSIAQGSGIINSIQKSAISLFLGFSPTPDRIGVLYDLRPGTARQIATQNNVYPRLRFVGTGSEYLSATKPFIAGSDDSVVPLHSSCGAPYKSSYDSCSRSVQVNGVLTSVSAAPSSLRYNHFAVLMGEGTNHSEAINNSRSGNFTTVTNNQSFGGVVVDFATQTSRKWWAFWRKVRTVRDGDRKSMSANVYDTLNN